MDRDIATIRTKQAIWAITRIGLRGTQADWLAKMGSLSALPELDVKDQRQPDLLQKYAQLQQIKGEQQAQQQRAAMGRIYAGSSVTRPYRQDVIDVESDFVRVDEEIRRIEAPAPTRR